MVARNADKPEHRRMLFRIGINLGDVMHDETRIYGDGINVAARLQEVAEPGGICISRQVFDHINQAVKADFQALGPRRFKNITWPVDVFVLLPAGRNAPSAVSPVQQITFCTAPDGVRLAFSKIGRGPALVKTGNWMTHRPRKPNLAASLSRARQGAYADPVRRPRQRAVGSDRR
jgi:Adenylate and Guanylate cyclase catalytic domain